MTMMRVSHTFAVAGLLLAFAAAVPAFAQQGKCSNGEINLAYTAVMLRPANGSGNSGDCNPSLYGNWKTMQELQRNVVAYNNKPAAPAASVLAVPAQYTFYIDAQKNLVANTPAHTILAPAGTWDLRNPDGSAVSIVASGGGNIVASGGGNIVASGGGNMAGNRSLMSVGGKKVFVVTK